VMDSFAFDKFWATVAPLEFSANATLVPPHYPTFFTTTQPIYLSTIPRDNIYRQFFSLWFITVHTPYTSKLIDNSVDVRSDPILCLRFIIFLFHL